MIKFNDKESGKERSKTKPLTLNQEILAVATINRMIQGKKPTKGGLRVLQQFVNHYQNLCHYKAYTTGLWVADQKPFQLK